MIAIVPTVDDVQVMADLRGYYGKVTKAAVFALNRAIKSGQTEMARRIAQDTNLPVSTVKKYSRVSKATYQTLSAEFGGKLRRIPLIYFGARGPEPSRGKGRGVSYKAGGPSRSRAPHAFIARMPSGHRGVFQRHPTGMMKKHPRRQAIIELFGPSIGHVFRKFQADGAARTAEAFERYFDHEVNRLTLAREVPGA